MRRNSGRRKIITMLPTRADRINTAVEMALRPRSRKAPQTIDGARLAIYGLERKQKALTKTEGAEARRRVEAHFKQVEEIKRQQQRAREALNKGLEISRVKPVEIPFHKRVRERVIIHYKFPGAEFGTYSPEYNIFLLRKEPLFGALLKALESMEKQGETSFKGDKFEISLKRIHDIMQKLRTRSARLEEYVFWLGEMKKHGFLPKNFPEKRVSDLLKFNSDNKNLNSAIAVAIEQDLISAETAAKVLTEKIAAQKNITPDFLQKRTPQEIEEYRALARQSSSFSTDIQKIFQEELKRMIEDQPGKLRRGPSAINGLYEAAAENAYNKAGLKRTKRSEISDVIGKPLYGPSEEELMKLLGVKTRIGLLRRLSDEKVVRGIQKRHPDWELPNILYEKERRRQLDILRKKHPEQFKTRKELRESFESKTKEKK